MAERTGPPPADLQIVVVRDYIDSYLNVPRLRAKNVDDAGGSKTRPSESSSMSKTTESRAPYQPSVGAVYCFAGVGLFLVGWALVSHNEDDLVVLVGLAAVAVGFYLIVTGRLREGSR